MFHDLKVLAGAAAVCIAASSSQAATVAYDVASGTSGNQAYTGVLGMLFDVNSAINVFSLGVFDADSDGLTAGTTLTVELWSRTGTTGTSILASQTFTNASAGTLNGGSLFKTIAPQTLAAGEYAIVSYGYNANDKNGNTSGAASGPFGWTANSGGGLLSFVGSSQYNGTPGSTIGTIIDGGPANRYAAGTFTFAAVPVPAAGLMLLTALGGIAALRRKRKAA